MKNKELGEALGWFSVGLGLSALLAPRKTAGLAGINRNHQTMVRLVGAREIASGLGILSGQRPDAWLWSRVVGDAMDLALLATAFLSPKTKRTRLLAATAAVAGVTLADIWASDQFTRQQLRGNDEANRTQLPKYKCVRKSIVIDRSPAELYAIWRDFKNLPNFMWHLNSIETIGERKSHWIAKGPAGTTVEWDAEMTEDRPGELIAWRSLQGSQMETSGRVTFAAAPGGRGTIVRVDLHYSPPGGAIGAGIAKLLGQAPEKQVPVDLLRFKQFVETGEIAKTEGQSAGRPHSTSRKYDDLIRA
jgi:uncharacterized membrane protein